MTPQELKNSILQLAIQGKLVEQRPEEGTAEELYQQIQKEKQKLIKEGKIKKEKPLPEITEDDVPFDIPESWKWVRLGILIKVIGGVSYDKGDVAKSGFRILRGGNIQEMKVLVDEDDIFLPSKYADAEKTVRKGDILIVASTGSKTVIGKAGYIDRDLPNTMIGAFLRICRAHSLELIGYLKCIFESNLYRKNIRDKSQGTNINNVKESYITELAIPLPPLAEQKRIVAKIEELLPYIDRYEAAWSKLEDFNKRFPTDLQKSLLQFAI
jgi:type I restriction enzyme S subunit